MEKLNISLIITIATIIFSVGGSFAVIKAKTDDVDRLKDKTESVDKRLVKVEANIESIDDSLKEQKTDMREQRADIKQVLKLLSERP